MSAALFTVAALLAVVAALLAVAAFFGTSHRLWRASFSKDPWVVANRAAEVRAARRALLLVSGMASFVMIVLAVALTVAARPDMLTGLLFGGAR